VAAHAPPILRTLLPSDVQDPRGIFLSRFLGTAGGAIRQTTTMIVARTGDARRRQLFDAATNHIEVGYLIGIAAGRVRRCACPCRTRASALDPMGLKRLGTYGGLKAMTLWCPRSNAQESGTIGVPHVPKLETNRGPAFPAGPEVDRHRDRHLVAMA